MASILITGALSTKAHRLKNELAGEAVIMGDFNDVPAVMIKSGMMVKLPHPEAIAYPHQMLTFCLDNNVSSVYTLNTEEFIGLEPSMQLFMEYGIEIQIVKNDL